MPTIVDTKVYRRLMDELAAYRATGLTPDAIVALMAQDDAAPLPLPLTSPPIVMNDWEDK